MKPILQIISLLALAGTVLPSFLFFLGRIDLDQTKFMMLIGTITWFVVTPFWMDKKST